MLIYQHIIFHKVKWKQYDSEVCGNWKPLKLYFMLVRGKLKKIQWLCETLFLLVSLYNEIKQNSEVLFLTLFDYFS